jgi:hypothetical protein
VELDAAVERFGAAVVGPVGGEVGQQLVLRGAQGAAELAISVDRAAGQRFDHAEGDLLAVRWAWAGEGGAEPLGPAMTQQGPGVRRLVAAASCSAGPWRCQ